MSEEHVCRPAQRGGECKWEGELGQLEQRMNGCDYVEEDCAHECGGRFQPRVVRQHELETCSDEEVEEINTSSIVKNLETTLTENKLLREQIELIKKELDAVKMDHQHDAARLNQDQELQSLKEEVAQMKIVQEQRDATSQAVKFEEETQELKQKVDSILAENSSVKVEMDSLRQRIFDLEQSVDGISKSHLIPVPPFYFTLFNFEHHKKESLLWYSEPFYSHIGGYKMRAEVHAGGVHAGEGSHISLYMALMRGENDDNLQWPFRGKITVQVFCYNAWSSGSTIVIDHTADDACASKPLVDSIGNPSWGVYKFVSHASLDPGSDCIRFRVLQVELM